MSRKRRNFVTSTAVAQTIKTNPATHPMGFQFDSAKQVTDPRLKTLPAAPTSGGPVRAAAFASNTVQGPASIVELARALNVGATGNGPQLMYEFVANNIEWEPGWGANRGALGCLLDGMGDQFDQAMLLAGLLRQAGYTANIVMGTIRLTEAQYQAWWGVNDIWGAQSYCLNEFIPIVTVPTWNGTTYYMDIKHVWVEWVSTSTYIFDPSMKTYTRKSAMSGLASALGYSQSTFMTNAQSGATVTTDYALNINRANIRADLQTYAGNLATYIKNNTIGSAPAGTATVDDVLGGQEIVPVTLPLLQTSLPYQQPGDTPTRWSGDVPSSFKPTLRVQYPNWSNPNVWDMDYQNTSDNLAGKRFTLWYDANRVPSLYLDGTSVATGLQQPVGTWTSIFLTVTHPAYAASNYPLSWQQSYQTTWQWWQSQIYTVGSYLIGSAWGNLGRGQMDLHQEKAVAAEAAGGASSSEAVLGERLALDFYSWCAQNSRVCDLVNRLKNCHTMYNHQVGVVAFNSGGDNAIAGDLGGVSGSSTSLANDTTQTPINDTVLAMHGVALEAAVAAQITGLTPGVSTTSVIDKAVQDGNKIYKGTQANWNTGSNVRNTLVANGFNGTDMDNLYNWYIQWGDHVLIHELPNRTLGSWQGWGYWDYPAAGAYGIINGGIKGKKGQPGDPNKKPPQDKDDKDKDDEGDPIIFSTGAYVQEYEDITIGSGDHPYKLSFVRRYDSSRQYADGPFGRGWTHNWAGRAAIGSGGLQAMGENYAIQGAASIAELYVATDLIADTSRPVAKLVTVTLADAWWVDQIVNNIVAVQLSKNTHVFVKQPDGSYSSPYNNADTLTLVSGLYKLTTPQQVVYNFNSDGNLSTVVFPSGMTLTLSYTSGKLTSITNGLTRTLTLSYTGDYISSVSDGTGRSVSYSVNGTTKNLDSVTDPDSKTISILYDQPGRLTQIKYPANPTIAWITNVYDSLSRVKEQKDAFNNNWQYFLAGSRSEELDPQSNRKIAYFNRFGTTSKEIDQVGQVTKHEFDGLNRKTKTIFPEGNELRWTYDLKNNVLSETRVAKSGSGLANVVNSWTYHSTYNQPITHTDGRSNQTTFSYDASTGNLLTIQRPQVGGLTPTVTMTWNTRGQIKTRTDETSIVTEWNYDTTTEKLTSIVVDKGTGRLNLTTSFGYTSRGDVNSITDPRGKVTSFTWDVKRRLTQKQDPNPLSYVTNMYYDANDNRWKVERQTGDAMNPWQIYTATFNYMDQLKTVTNPANDVTTWDYDSLRRLWKFTDAELRVWENAYDAASRLYTVKDPSLVIVETRLYTNNGQLQSIKDARNATTSYSYDGHDRLDRTTYADSSYEQNQSYDGNHNVLVYRTRSGNTITKTFDALNREATRAPQGQATVTLTYDLANRLTKANKPVVSGDPSTGDFEFFFDTAGRFYKEKYPDAKIVEHVLDANGNITKTIYPDSWYSERFYDELNRLTDIKLNGSGTAAAHFDWDPLSRRKKLTYQNGVVTDYTHQLDDDLASIVHTFTGSSVTFTLGYDKTHKMNSQQVSDGANYMWHPAAAGTTTYGTATNLNQYPTIGGVTQSYNSNGCLTGDGTWTFDYDTENHLLTASKTGVSVTNRYDPMHRQREHQVDSVKNRYIYAGWQRIADYDGVTDTLQSRYVYGTALDDVLIKVASGGALTYYSHNHQGSVVALADSSGTATNRYKYSPWGESPSLSGTTHGFTGQRFESESGLYYMKARYYSPANGGRFLQPDPILYAGGDLNLYTYVGNCPLKFTDPLGLQYSGKNVTTNTGKEVGVPIGTTGFKVDSKTGSGEYTWRKSALDLIPIPDDSQIIEIGIGKLQNKPDEKGDKAKQEPPLPMPKGPKADTGTSGTVINIPPGSKITNPKTPSGGGAIGGGSGAGKCNKKGGNTSSNNRYISAPVPAESGGGGGGGLLPTLLSPFTLDTLKQLTE